MIKLKNPAIRNSLIKMFNTNKSYVSNEITRMGSNSHLSTSSMRNGMLDFGSRQMIAMSGENIAWTVGSGGGPIVSQ